MNDQHIENEGLGDLLKVLDEDPAASPSVAQLQKEARAFGHRRADAEGSRDNLVYRLGYALDAAGALDLSPTLISGVLSSPAFMLEYLKSHSRLPEESCSVLALIRELAVSKDPLCEMFEKIGRDLEWDRLTAAHFEEVTAFKASPAFADPEARWRRKAPTIRQRYLISEIVRLGALDDPSIKTRGEAFDFIDHHGGNPRFLERDDQPVQPNEGAK